MNKKDEVIKVRVERADSNIMWYKNKIGKEFNVIMEFGEKYYVEHSGNTQGVKHFILKSDCTIISKVGETIQDASCRINGKTINEELSSKVEEAEEKKWTDEEADKSLEWATILAKHIQHLDASYGDEWTEYQQLQTKGLLADFNNYLQSLKNKQQ